MLCCVYCDVRVQHCIVHAFLSLFGLLSSHVCGSLGYYDVAKEKKISLKSPLPLQSCDRVFHKVTTTDDPVIRRVSEGTAWKSRSEQTTLSCVCTVYMENMCIAH